MTSRLRNRAWHLSRDLAQRIPHIPEKSRDQNKARHPTRNLVAHKKTQGVKSVPERETAALRNRAWPWAWHLSRVRHPTRNLIG